MTVVFVSQQEMKIKRRSKLGLFYINSTQILINVNLYCLAVLPKYIFVSHELESEVNGDVLYNNLPGS